MPGTRSIRTGLVDTGFALADRLEGAGLGRLTHAARRLVARAGIDQHTVEVHGVRVSGSLADHGTYLHSLSGPVGRSFHLELFGESIPPGATVVDCGAHIGLHTLVAARAVGDGGTVVSLEPVPQSARALRSNVEENGFEDRVEVVQAAATRDPGSVLMHLHPWLDRAGLSEAGDGSGETIEVAGVPLDDALGDRRFDVAKIDVEGAEALVLSGFERAVARSPGATIFLECHPDRMRELGEKPDAWLRELSARGPLELVDEGQRRLIAADDDSISRWVEGGQEALNLRWRPES